jgi:ABC-2 type transport system permease protein
VATAQVSTSAPTSARRQVMNSTLFILRQLVSKDFKLKYRRSILGVVWSVLNPLLMMAVMTLVFSSLFRFNIEHFPLYLILGSTLFTLMSDATSGAMSSIIDASSLLKKVRIKKWVFPLERVLFAVVNFGLSLVAVLGVMVFFMIFGDTSGKLEFPGISMLALPLLVFYVLLFSVGLGLALSALSVFFRDVMHLWSVVIMAWNYLTPVFWPQDLEQFVQSMPESRLLPILQTIEQFNPMYHYVVYFRDIFLYGNVPGLQENLICLLFAVVSIALGALIFKKTQSKFILYI